MQTTVFLTDVRPLVEEERFHRLFLQVSRERQQDILKKRRKKDQFLSLAGGLLLDALLQRSGIAGSIVHAPSGKPEVEGNPSVHVSLTHCYPYAAAVISDHPCGIDIESRSRDLSLLVRKVYLPADKAFAGDDPAKYTDIWSRKECCVKCGFAKDLRTADAFSIPAAYRYESIPLEGFSFEVLFSDRSVSFHRIDLNMK